jgi:hypothetical protein
MRLLREFGLTLLGLLALVWPWTTVKPFANDDFDTELTTTNHHAKLSDTQLAKERTDYQKETKRRFKGFRRGFWGSFIFLVSAIVIAVITGSHSHPSSEVKTLLGALSIFVFAWATLARIGHDAES